MSKQWKSILGQSQRVKFDPKNPAHRKAYATFELTGRWTIKFDTEWPYITVPQTVMHKMSRVLCDAEFKEVQKQLEQEQTANEQREARERQDPVTATG